MNFIEKYFIRPITEKQGYNPVNTAVFALVLLALLPLIIKLLEKMKTNIKGLWFKLIPIVITAGVIRALQDKNFFASIGALQYLFVTPLIYFLFFTITITVLYFKKEKYFPLFLIVIVPLILRTKDWNVFILVITQAAAVTSTALLLRKTSFSKHFKENTTILFGHSLDAIATITAISRGYSEQHLLTSKILLINPWLYLIIKAAITIIIVLLIEKESTQPYQNFVFRFTLLCLGLGPGIRDLTTMMM